MKDTDFITGIETLTEHAFVRSETLIEAFTHTSYANEKGKEPHYERLEFLGDAVIGLAIAKELMKLFPEADEGLLSRWRSGLVSRKALAHLAIELGLPQYLRLGRGERQTGGEKKESILAGTFEALVGALFLDAGYDRAACFVLKVFHNRFSKLLGEDLLATARWDKKTFLQERTQGRYRTAPTYKVISTQGKDHEKIFSVEVELLGRVIASGEGRSKKEAEQVAAARALENWEMWA